MANGSYEITTLTPEEGAFLLTCRKLSAEDREKLCQKLAAIANANDENTVES